MSEETATATASSESEEPSMEDILSSIRKILAEEEGEGGEPVKGDKSIEQEEVVSEPKDSEQQTPAEETVAGATSEPQNTQEDTPQEEGKPEMVAPISDEENEIVQKKEPIPGANLEEKAIPDVGIIPEPMAEILELTPDMVASDILSQPTARASVDVLSELASAILDRRDVHVNAGGKELTLESMVREMLKPILREWLDRNLPYLIERLVKKEIDLMVNRAERLDL